MTAQNRLAACTALQLTGSDMQKQPKTDKEKQNDLDMFHDILSLEDRLRDLAEEKEDSLEDILGVYEPEND